MQAKERLLQIEYQLKMELAKVEAEAMQGARQEDMAFRANLEQKREESKDERVKKQAVEQSKLISQRQGQRGELEDTQADILSQIIGNQ